MYADEYPKIIALNKNCIYPIYVDTTFPYTITHIFTTQILTQYVYLLFSRCSTCRPTTFAWYYYL